MSVHAAMLAAFSRTASATPGYLRSRSTSCRMSACASRSSCSDVDARPSILRTIASASSRVMPPSPLVGREPAPAMRYLVGEPVTMSAHRMPESFTATPETTAEPRAAERTGARATDSPRPTTIVEAPRLAAHLGVDVFLASETFQRTGSFKFRAAFNVVSNVPHPHVITASSGNFGQAMAYACKLFGKRCTIVMPANSARVKVDAVLAYGGRVDLVDTAKFKRAARVAQLAEEHPEAYIASAYDDPFVISGNSSLGDELAALDTPPDVVVAPVGGGGLTAGLV